jgi:ribonuclease P protein component
LPYRLTAGARITSRKDFQRVFKQGRKVVGRNAIVWSFIAPDGEKRTARLGLSVSGKVGIAVVRNRFKRLTREAFRLNRARLACGSDIVVYLRPGCAWKKFGDAEKDLLELWRKSSLLKS